MPLAMKNHAKKVQVIPRTKNCIPSLSNLTRIINVLKIGGRISFWQEVRQASSKGGYFKKRELVLKERWPSDWNYLSVVRSIYQNLGISLISDLE